MQKKQVKRSKMSRTQKEEIAIINTELKYIKEKLDEARKHNEDIKNIINKFIESADKKFASKKVESIVYSMVAIILISFLTALVRIVIASGK